LKGYPVASCSSDRQWKFGSSIDMLKRPTCQRITCEPPPLVDNGFAPNLTFTYGEAVAYTCILGYEINVNSSNELRCTAEVGNSKVPLPY